MSRPTLVPRPLLRVLALLPAILLVQASASWAGGAELWSRRLNGPGDGEDQGFAIAASPDGLTVYMTGSSERGPNDADYVTIAYDPATGARKWVSDYNGPGVPGNGNDAAKALAVSPDGSTVFVTGASSSVDHYVDYATVAYDTATGAQNWVRRYTGPENSVDIDEARAIGLSPDGSKVFVTGTSSGQDGGMFAYDYATVAYQASTGRQLWVARYNSPADDDDQAYALAVGPGGGNLFVTGWSVGAGTGIDYATVAYSTATGTQLWATRYDSGSSDDDEARSIAVSPGGDRVFVTGSAGIHFGTVAYSAASGVQLWGERFDGPGDGPDTGVSVAVSPGGSKVFVTGTGSGPTDFDYATVAYDASSGARLWTGWYQGPGAPNHANDYPSSVRVGPSGTKVFVTGTSQGTGGGSFFNDYGTVAYSAATGAQLWVARYNGPANDDDSAYGLAVAPGGKRVFVTGASGTSNGYDDYATVAYDA